MKKNINIVIIDDNMKEDDPIVVILKKEYVSVSVFEKTDDGVAYIEQNISDKMIVLLDIMFGGRPEGLRVFEKIMSKTSLICFIIRTGNRERIEREDFIDLINHHAWYFLKSDDDSKTIRQTVENAANYMNTRVDCALEEWILSHSNEQMETPYLKTRNGDTYTLNDILGEIRKGTAFGNQMVSNILNLTVELLARNKEKL